MDYEGRKEGIAVPLKSKAMSKRCLGLDKCMCRQQRAHESESLGVVQDFAQKGLPLNGWRNYQDRFSEHSNKLER